MQNYSKTFVFPKIAVTSARKVNLPEVKLELKDKDGKYALSIYGSVWNARHTDIVMCGQCLDHMNEFASLAKDKTFQTLYRLWKLYHLNDCRCGGPIQEAALKECKSSSYEDRCAYLESINLLYEDGIKYGSKWWHHEIPEEDLNLIKEMCA